MTRRSAGFDVLPSYSDLMIGCYSTAHVAVVPMLVAHVAEVPMLVVHVAEGPMLVVHVAEVPMHVAHVAEGPMLVVHVAEVPMHVVPMHAVGEHSGHAAGPLANWLWELLYAPSGLLAVASPEIDQVLSRPDPGFAQDFVQSCRNLTIPKDVRSGCCLTDSPHFVNPWTCFHWCDL